MDCVYVAVGVDTMGSLMDLSVRPWNRMGPSLQGQQPIATTYISTLGNCTGLFVPRDDKKESGGKETVTAQPVLPTIPNQSAVIVELYGS